MSKWDDIKRSLGEFADKTAKKTRELTDAAALKIKIANKEADRDAEYKNLGRLAYVRLKKAEGYDSEELTEDISRSLEKLDGIIGEIEALKAEEAEKKAAKEAEKANQDEDIPKDDEKAASSDTLDLAVMKEFNEARKVADEEYEKAKQAAEDAK
jgi:hypothetical protein